MVVVGSVGTASAHTVVVDGLTTDWSTRVPAQSNLGIVARDSANTGEYIFVDATGDHRTDAPGSTENDITRVQVTGDATNLYFLVRAGGVSTENAQVQITIDTDRITGFGQNFLAGFADTTVVDDARWEFLVQTQLNESPAGTGAHVYNTAFGEVGDATAVQNAVTGDIEIAVPWSVIGLPAPPTTPLRFTVSTYVAVGTSDMTTDIGGPMISNAFDAIGDCGNPAATGYPNAWDCDLSDGDLDYFVDVWFESDGDVYSPLLVTHMVPRSSLPEPDREWVAIRNVSPNAISLDNFKIGDEETPDGGEGMFVFPSGLTINPGDTFIIAADGDDYNTRWGEPPTVEITGTTSAPNATLFMAFATGSWNLSSGASGGDNILILGPSNQILDLVNFNYGTSTSGNYAGVTPLPIAAPVNDQIYLRTTPTQDTDNNAVDFAAATSPSCALETDCPGTTSCTDCTTNLCVNLAAGSSCSDGNLCNGSETCDGAGLCPDATDAPNGTSCSDGDVCNGLEICQTGACMAGSPLVCGDTNPCTDDSCDPTTGCTFPAFADGTACPDGDACNGAEVCTSGTCMAGTPPNCDDANACTADSCDTALGCVNDPVADGTACTDADLCDGAETCLSGTCTAGTPIPCDDANACNGVETCDAPTGMCQPGTPPTCVDDGNECTLDMCDMVLGCVSIAQPGQVCNDDGDACNGVSTCDADGNCLPGEPVMCPPTGNPCTIAGCDPDTGACETVNAAPGTDCDDGDPCNGVDTCDGAGTCAPGEPPVDGGVCDPDAGPTADAGLEDGGPIDAALPPDAAIPGGDDDGCGCRAGGASNPGGAFVLAIAALFIGLSRRRRTR